jgi:monoamine oxidase
MRRTEMTARRGTPLGSRDVVIIGAGLAGLSAGYALHGAGADVLVLEAAEEVGGRTRSRSVEGEMAEFGAEWVGRRHVQLLALMNTLGVATRPARQIYYPILWRGRCGARLLVPHIASGQLALVPQVLWKAARLARLLHPAEPWSSPAAPHLDRVSFGRWLRQAGIRDDGYYFFDKVIGALSSTPIDRLSLLHVLWWIRRGAGPLTTLWTTFERNIPAGAQAIARALADRLPERVILGTPAIAIAHTQQGVEIATGNGATVHAHRAIVTAPLGTLNRIAFDPPLAPELAALDQLSIDPGTKVVAHLPANKIPIQRVFVGGEVLSGGWRVGTRITGFAPCPAGDAPDDRLIADLARGFGVPPTELISPMLYRWSQRPFLPGCDIGFAPGELTRHGPHLRTPHGHVHFAGTERSSWPNNMEGAVESGSRVAREVIAGLPH